MLTSTHRNRFNKEHNRRARRIVVDCACDGLPTEPVMSKVLDAMARSADRDRSAMDVVPCRRKAMGAAQAG